MKSKHPFIFPLIISILCISLLAMNSCSKGSDPAPAGGGGPTTTNISIQSMSYSPSTVTVAKGTTVKWTNTDGTDHTVTSNDGSSFNSNNIAPAGIFTYTANTAGTFNYHCTIHGLAMSGVLVVNP